MLKTTSKDSNPPVLHRIANCMDIPERRTKINTKHDDG